nr:TPA_asm: hypothetical protein [Triaenorhabdovirus 1]
MNQDWEMTAENAKRSHPSERETRLMAVKRKINSLRRSEQFRDEMSSDSLTWGDEPSEDNDVLETNGWDEDIDCSSHRKRTKNTVASKDYSALAPDVHLNSPLIQLKYDRVCDVAAYPINQLRDEEKEMRALWENEKRRGYARVEVGEGLVEVMYQMLLSEPIPVVHTSYSSSARANEKGFDPLDQALVEYVSAMYMDCREAKDTGLKIMANLNKRSDNPEISRYEQLAKTLYQGVLWGAGKQKGDDYETSFPSSELIRHGWTRMRRAKFQRSCDGITCSFRSKNTGIVAYQIEVGSRSLIIRDLTSKRSAIGNWEPYLCLSDTVYSRWLALVWSSCDSFMHGHKLPSPSQLCLMYKSGDKLLAILGNAGYNIMKQHESMCCANLLESLGKGIAGITDTRYITTIREDFSKNVIKFKVMEPGDDYRKSLLSIHPSIMLEYSGCFRHWGHPFVHVEEGLTTVRTNATIVKDIDCEIMSELADDLAKIILVNYWNKHGTWPPGSSCPETYTLMHEFIGSGRFPSKSDMKRLGAIWRFITYDAAFSVPTDLSVLELITDKSHAPQRRELVDILKRNSKPILANMTISRKVLTTTLSYDHVDPMEFLNNIDNSEDGLSAEDLIILLKAKEREQKPGGRMFSLMTYPLRLYFTGTEYLISKFIIPLIPEITVNNDYPTLLKAMHEGSATSNRDSSMIKIYLSLDFEKWNNHQRHESTYDVFQVIDKSFGWSNVVSRTHKFFSRSFVGYADRLDCIPSDLSENHPWCWKNHLGGLEGLRQKGWSVVGALLLRAASRKTGVNFRVLLQGDNQIVIISRPCKYIDGSPEWVKEATMCMSSATKLLDTIAKLSSKIGLITKKEETWASASLLLYGKAPVIGGTMMGATIKRASRMFSTSGDMTPGLTNSLSSSVTTCLSIAQQMSQVLLPIVFGYWFNRRTALSQIAYSYIAGGSLLSSFKIDARDHQILSKRLNLLIFDILTRDSSLGGIGGTSPIRFFIRQFPDPLTESLVSIKLGASACSNISFRNVLKAQANPLLGPTPNYSLLLENPTGLNLRHTARPNQALKDMVKKNVLTLENPELKNKEMRQALQCSADNEDRIVEWIMSFNPVMPKYNSEVYAATAMGVAKSLVNKFLNTKTMINAATREGKTAVRDKLALGEMNLCSVFIEQHMQLPADLAACMTDHAKQLRNRSWKKELLGVTLPHPAEQFMILPTVGNICSMCSDTSVRKEAIKFQVNPKCLTHRSNMFIRGPWRPYLGGVTKERRIATAVNEASTDLSAIQRLLKVRKAINWFVEPDDLIAKGLNEMFTKLTKLDSSVLPSSHLVLSGDAEHRYRSDRVSQGGFVTNNFNSATNISFSTNDLVTLGKGEDNMVIMFQGIFIYYQQMISERFQFTKKPLSVMYHVHPRCLKCVYRTEDVNMSTTSKMPKWTIARDYSKCKVTLPAGTKKNYDLWAVENPLDHIFVSVNMKPIIVPWASNHEESRRSLKLAAILALVTDLYIQELAPYNCGAWGSVSLFRTVSIEQLEEELIEALWISRCLYWLRKTNLVDKEVSWSQRWDEALSMLKTTTSRQLTKAAVISGLIERIRNKLSSRGLRIASSIPDDRLIHSWISYVVETRSSNVDDRIRHTIDPVFFIDTHVHPLPLIYPHLSRICSTWKAVKHIRLKALESVPLIKSKTCKVSLKVYNETELTSGHHTLKSFPIDLKSASSSIDIDSTETRDTGAITLLWGATSYKLIEYEECHHSCVGELVDLEIGEDDEDPDGDYTQSRDDLVWKMASLSQFLDCALHVSNSKEERTFFSNVLESDKERSTEATLYDRICNSIEMGLQDSTHLHERMSEQAFNILRTVGDELDVVCVNDRQLALTLGCCTSIHVSKILVDNGLCTSDVDNETIGIWDSTVLCKLTAYERSKISDYDNLGFLTGLKDNAMSVLEWVSEHSFSRSSIFLLNGTDAQYRIVSLWSISLQHVIQRDNVYLCIRRQHLTLFAKMCGMCNHMRSECIGFTPLKFSNNPESNCVWIRLKCLIRSRGLSDAGEGHPMANNILRSHQETSHDDDEIACLENCTAVTKCYPDICDFTTYTWYIREFFDKFMKRSSSTKERWTRMITGYHILYMISPTDSPVTSTRRAGIYTSQQFSSEIIRVILSPLSSARKDQHKEEESRTRYLKSWTTARNMYHTLGVILHLTEGEDNDQFALQSAGLDELIDDSAFPKSAYSHVVCDRNGRWNSYLCNCEDPVNATVKVAARGRIPDCTHHWIDDSMQQAQIRRMSELIIEYTKSVVGGNDRNDWKENFTYDLWIMWTKFHEQLRGRPMPDRYVFPISDDSE